MAFDTSQQYGRVCSLIVFGNDDKGLDLSELRIKFSVKRSNAMTPNTADIRVYNLTQETASLIRKEFKKVILQAGYAGNFGVIFRGNIKQVIIGRESTTETFVEIVAGDGDQAYNFAVVNKTLAAGSTQIEQVNEAINSMVPKGVTQGYVQLNTSDQLPRGKVMFGNAINYLRNVAESTDQQWSIQDEQVQFVSLTSYLPGEATVINSSNGLIGSPQQTNEGVNLKCLLNPLLQVSGRVKLNNTEVQSLKINLEVTNAAQIAASIAAPLNADGVYYIFVVEHIGDTRGIEWYSNLITLIVDTTTNPRNSVQMGTSGGS